MRFTSNSEKKYCIHRFIYSLNFLTESKYNKIFLPTLKLLVLKVGHVNNLGNIM